MHGRCPGSFLQYLFSQFRINGSNKGLLSQSRYDNQSPHNDNSADNNGLLKCSTFLSAKHIDSLLKLPSVPFLLWSIENLSFSVDLWEPVFLKEVKNAAGYSPMEHSMTLGWTSSDSLEIVLQLPQYIYIFFNNFFCLRMPVLAKLHKTKKINKKILHLKQLESAKGLYKKSQNSSLKE